MHLPFLRLSATILALLAIPVQADDATSIAAEPLTLGQIEVNANRESRSPDVPVTPSPNYVIDAKKLAQVIVIDPEDALKYAPNLHVRKRGIGDNNATVSVRSTSTRQSARTLVYADGLLLSNLLGSDFSFPPRWSMVTPNEIRRVDVLYGPYSARYPGNSLGATVLISTRMPEAFEASAKLQAFSQSYAHNGVDRDFNGFQTSASVGSRSGPWSYRVDIDHLDSETQPLSFYTVLQSTMPADATDTAGSGAVPWKDQLGRAGYLLGVNSEGITKIRNDQFKFKLAYDIGDEVQIALTAVNWRQDMNNATHSMLRDSSGNPVNAGDVSINGFRYSLPQNAFAPSNSDSNRNLIGLSLRSSHDSGWNYSITGSHFGISNDRARTAAGPGSRPGSITFADGTGWTTFDAIFDYTPGPLDSPHAWSMGVHSDRYSLDNETFNTLNWRDGSRESFNNAFAGQTETRAVFIEDRWMFAPQWTLTPGLRFEQWSANNGRRGQGAVSLDYASRSTDYVSPKLALAREFGDGWTARLSLGRAVRFPTVSELFQGKITGTSIVNNDPNLRPEDSFSKDFTIEHRVGKSRLRFSLYEDDVRDALFNQTNTEVFPNITNIQNIERVRTRGAEVAFESSDLWFDGFDLSASIARNRAIIMRNDKFPLSEGKFFYRIPDWRADVLGTWRITPALSTTLAARYSGRQYNTLDNIDVHPRTFGGTSRYLVVDAKVNYAAGEHMSLSLGVENLNNEEYYVYHPYPGRTWVAEMAVKY